VEWRWPGVERGPRAPWQRGTGRRGCSRWGGGQGGTGVQAGADREAPALQAGTDKVALALRASAAGITTGSRHAPG
jgi:hypothetical protein